LNKFTVLYYLDLFIFILNFLLIYLFYKFRKFSFINILIIINASRLLYNFYVFGTEWYLNHAVAVIMLLTINLFNKEAIMKTLFSIDKYLRFLVIIFIFVFTFKENFQIIHPGIGGWTYQYSSDFLVNNPYELVYSNNENLWLKEQIKNQTPNTNIKGFRDEYVHSYQLEVVKTNIGDFVINGEDYAFVFPFEIFKQIRDGDALKELKKEILVETLCDRINGKRFLINRNFSYANHSVYFKLKPIDSACGDNFKIEDIELYIVTSNILNETYEVKKVEIKK